MDSDREHAFLSNCRSSALEVGGEIDWFPSPRFDSGSVFGKVLGPKAGSFSIFPNGKYSSESSYLGNSLALATTFKTKHGALRLTDFLPLGQDAIVRMYDSSIAFNAVINPMFGYGKYSYTIGKKGEWLTFNSTGSKERLEVLIKGKCALGNGKIEFEKGRGYLVAFYSRGIRKPLSGKPTVLDPYVSLRIAEDYWESAVSQAMAVSNFKDAYSRSIAVSIGCTYMPTGAVIAAPTTSIPEIIGGQRNWDYRYCWVRDSSYAAESLAKAGLCFMSRKILSFLLGTTDRSSGSFAHPLFSVDGGSPESERTLDWLDGYMGSRPVRVGNAAFEQLQMDSEGNFLNALHVYFRRSGDAGFIRRNWRIVDAMASRVVGSWKDRSTSLWEEREELQHFVHTKVMGWVALHRASSLARSIGKRKESERFADTCRAIKADVMKNGFSESENSFTKYYGSSEVDAALLTLPLYGFIDASDEKFSLTLKRILKELQVSPGLLIRYRTDAMGSVAHPFTLLSFWLSRVYLRRNERREAMAVIRKILSYSTRLGLMAEHVDYKTRAQRGNFPQLFPHSGLIETLAESEDKSLMEI